MGNNCPQLCQTDIYAEVGKQRKNAIEVNINRQRDKDRDLDVVGFVFTDKSNCRK